uniref:REP element-mobilizing transposase RayT n=1 Tax=Candidatus Kentrum sp. TC TaxID=2126339 RepID=A0A450Z3N0_9GAMM|nr:MAG: REP element-mobilizing transposase RayT [Candidatus Kentron sp. TC]
MTRPLRIEFPGALYHVTSRGNSREDIYWGNTDRELFMTILGEVCRLYNWSIHAWCLMTNHYHVLVETPDANLSKGMRYLNGIYTQRFNRRHGRVGHVYQGRYKAILVEKEIYLLELARYIVLNPVRAGMVDGAEHWIWSSYRATAGLADCPSWFDQGWLLSGFGEHESDAVPRYLRFVTDGMRQPSPWNLLKHQIYLGGKEFIERTRRVVKDRDLSEIPKGQRRDEPMMLKEYTKMAETRNEAIILAYRSGGYTLKQIGNYFGLHYSTVSRIIYRDAKVKT